MEPVKPRRFNHLTVIIVILFITLGAGSYLVWKNANNKGPDIILSAITPTVTTDIVQDTLKTRFSPDEISFSKESVGPYWSVDNSRFFVNYRDEGASSLIVSFDDSELVSNEEVTAQRTQIIESITTSLISQNFEKVLDSGYGKLSDAYVTSELVCVLDSATSGSLDSPVSLKCGDQYQYNVEADSYKTSQVFASAYALSGRVVRKGDVFTISSNVESATDGYKKATVAYRNVSEDGEAKILFYKKADADWKYFTLTQAEISCEAYDTEELMSAFSNDSCYDKTNAVMSKVR